MRNDGGDVSGAFARVFLAFAWVSRRFDGVSEASLSFLRCAEGLQSCCIMHDVTLTPSEMADLMFDVLYVVAACSASRCTRLECVQRRAARALHELLYVCTCCTRWA